MSSPETPAVDTPISVEEHAWETEVGYDVSKAMIRDAQPQIDRVMEKTETLKKTVKKTAAAMEEMKKRDK